MNAPRYGRDRDEQILSAIIAQFRAAERSESAILSILANVRENHPGHYAEAEGLLPDGLRRKLQREPWDRGQEISCQKNLRT